MTWEQVLRLKSADRVALTTDQTAAAGAAAGHYRLGGRVVVSDGRSVRLLDGTRAGSAVTMDSLVGRLSRLPGAKLADAVTMASGTPAPLGEPRLGRLRAGAHADLVILDRECRVRLTMVGGRIVFER